MVLPGEGEARKELDMMVRIIPQTNGARSVAIGTGAKTNGDDSFAFGFLAKTGEFSLGKDAYIEGNVNSSKHTCCESDCIQYKFISIQAINLLHLVIMH